MKPALPVWTRRHVGGWITTDGKWSIRGPIWGKPMYWLYGPADKYGRAGRYSPTGKYNDSVNFKTVASAKRYVEQFYTINPAARPQTKEK